MLYSSKTDGIRTTHISPVATIEWKKQDTGMIYFTVK